MLRVRRRRVWWAWVGLAVYAAILVVSPVLHHDLACHVKSPTHCEACATNPLASRTEPVAAITLPGLAVAGDVVATAIAQVHTASLSTVSGRAPPA
jgi:hypothetical protein